MRLDVGHGVAQLLGQHVGQRQRQLQGDEHRRHLFAQARQVLLVALGRRLLEGSEGIAQRLHARGDFLRVRTGRCGFFLATLDIIVLVLVAIGVGIVAVVGRGSGRRRHFVR
ncbi:hypothetical protein G6F24_017200 [Rhizopus arrhizus]|nr:hypothetical protein G6F24_017200 [Rhizopus arrhizus]